MDRKDLETITKVFAALSKAKWDGLDGNAVIELHGTFVALRKLEEKLKQELETAPVSVSEAKPEKVKKNAPK